ncbi:MAG: hypothetical protein LBL56_06300 [Treponema sp.]|jgi:hypothetical protein|nr:hypothetical protein [Treponema sp.]
MATIDEGSKFEAMIGSMYRSSKIRKALTVLSFTGIAVCMLVLIPPVQKAIFAFVGSVVSGRSSAENIQNRLVSLLSLAVLGLAALILLLCCLYSKKIAGVLSNPKNNRIISGLGLGIVFLGIIFIAVISYLYGQRWLNSDHASEIILGELLAKENALLSRQWYYSTELRLVYQTLFFVPLFKIFGNLNNWVFIRAAAIFLNNALLVISYIFMMRQTRIQNKWICLSAVFLLAPLSFEYWDIVTFGGYYVFFIIQNFFCLGLFFRLAAPPAPVRWFRRDFLLFGILSFILGVQGIRSLLCIQIPLMLTCFSACRIDRRNGIPPKKLPVYLGIFGFILCCAGFAANYLLRFIYSFQSFDSAAIDDLYESFFIKLGQNIVSLFSFFGFGGGHSVLSAWGAMDILAIIFTLCLLGSAIAALRQNHDRKGVPHQNGYNEDGSWPKQFIALYFFVSLVFNVFVFQIFNGPVTARYFIPFLILYVPLLAVLFEKTEKRKSPLLKTGILAAVFLFILTRSVLNFQDLSGRDVNRSRTGYIKYLSDHELKFGFATFWNANVTTELTNGGIRIAGLEVYGLEPGARFDFQRWLIRKEYLERSYYDGESFLLLTGAEWDLARQTGRPFTEKTPDYDDGEFIILRYPSAAIIHDTVLDD